MGQIKAICISERRGTPKVNIGKAEFVENYGISGDAHAGHWHRQVSLLSFEAVETFKKRGADVSEGAFGENLLVSEIDFPSLPIGAILTCNKVVLEITQIGKECHSHCAIHEQVGDCIMPREGVFAVVQHGGTLAVGDELVVN